ncbi:3'(2'),5'-bisphosphate nucleotidase CysQ [Bacteroidota bacterium]|nr:3'(2'),5'-bisphosphate nucleotidase CysQ [Bacteroidota bacterium]
MPETDSIKMIADKIELKLIEQIARKSGAAIMEIYKTEFSVEMKENKSPLTEADKISNKIILEELNLLYPSIPFISEETKAIEYNERINWNYCWLIDPIDGTKEFIKKNGEFTVNIALVENGKPTIGVVFAPALNKMWSAKIGEGSFKIYDDGERVKLFRGVDYKSLAKVRVIGSRSHMNFETETFIEQLKKEGKEIDFVSAGSSLKFCLLAQGSADVYPRYAPTMEWDTAAGHAVLEIAGGAVNEAGTMKPLLYNKENLLNPYFLASW